MGNLLTSAMSRIGQIIAVYLFVVLMVTQANAQAKGKLFIIGGGDRTTGLMQCMVQAAGMQDKDYVAVLPMSSAEPDTAFHYFTEDLKQVYKGKIVQLHFTKADTANQEKLQQLLQAKLIFITGGDQERFMRVVANTQIERAIHQAHAKGAMIAGTSAGAAVMSEHMITGNELTDTVYRPTFRKVWHNNIELSRGLGLIRSAIIDQHFIVRSRYNRLFSAIAKYPNLLGIGIDEATAILVEGNTATVCGESQVVVMRDIQGLNTTDPKRVYWDSLQVSLYISGQSFSLRTP
ncbi:MAG TPA: cyanophycinase [Chitinophagaceae bacterium]|nr:cyanophycinase [Chitinophagaceae bacterium]